MNILDFLFPKTCCGCGKLGSYLCPKCSKEIYQKELFCPYCRRPSLGGATHPLCQKKYGLDGLWSLGLYRDSLAKAIRKLKYRFVSDLGETLVDLMIKYWPQAGNFMQG